MGMGKNNMKTRGTTLSELLVTMAIAVTAVAGILSSTAALRKSFVASEYHVKSQAAQMLLLDYVALDLRRAISVSVLNNSITITIPDYYDNTGTPRTPQMKNGGIVYGTTPQVVQYSLNNNKLIRTQGTKTTVLADNAETFHIQFADNGQSISVDATFVPKYSFSGNTQTLLDGTRISTTILLRNKRS